MNDFDEYEDSQAADDVGPLSNKQLFKTSLDNQARRLSNAIDAMKNKNTKISFKLDPSIANEIKKMADFENVSLSEMSRRLLIEYLNND